MNRLGACFVIFLGLFGGRGTCFSQSPAQRFFERLDVWRSWYETQLDRSFACEVESDFQDGSKSRKRILRNGRQQTAIIGHTLSNGKKIFSAELSNPTYLASLESKIEGKWLISDLVEPSLSEFKRLRTNLAGEFESVIGSGLYYLDVKDSIESVVECSGSGDCFDVQLRTSAFPSDIPEFRPLPDRMIVKFGEFGLPVEMRLHCTFRGFNYAVKNEYMKVDDKLRLVVRQEFSGFPDVAQPNLLNYDFLSKYSSFRELVPDDQSKFRLPHYGLKEPKLQSGVSEYRYWIALSIVMLLIVVSLGVFVRRIRK